MHHISITMKPSPVYKKDLFVLITLIVCTLFLTPSLSEAKKQQPQYREDTVIGTDSSDITITEDYPSGDRVLEVKTKKQEKEDCNKYTSGQYPIIIELKPDISNYKK